MEQLLSKLNEQQLAAVTAQNQYIRVIAGAGSGKTRVLTNRIIYLVEKLGIAPHSILAITFTNKAAREMKKRVIDFLGEEQERMHISTFHSFCNRMLREDIRVLGYPSSFVIIDEEEKEKVIRRMIKDFNARESVTVGAAINYISRMKNAQVSVQEADNDSQNLVIEKIKASIYRKYEKYINEKKYVDFDDLIIYAVKILKNFPQIRAKWQSRFQYILVDEFQDTNDLQFQLIQLLTSPQTALFVVGDPDQNIYTWRGANLKIILDFNRHYPNTRDIVLHQNYRSTQNILDAANRLIQFNQQRVHKDLLTDSGQGGKVLYYEALSHEIEAQWVVDRIRELKRKNPSLDYRDFAILYRSNYYSRDIESKCIRSGIPYEIYGGTRFFERKEVKDAICYLRIIVNPTDDLAFERIVNTPKRGIGERSLEVLREEAQIKLTSMFAIASEKITKIQDFFTLIDEAKLRLQQEHANYAEILRYVLNESGYYAMILAQDQDEDSDRSLNIQAVYDYLFDAQRNNPGISVDEILQNIALVTAQDEMHDSNHVSLMTIHTAKGLEFPFVFVIGLTEKVFPAHRSVTPNGDEHENKNGVEEERRLAYVAFTRAQKQLFLSCSVGFNYSVSTYGVPSRFLEEIKDKITPYYIKQAPPSRARSLHKKNDVEASTMMDSTFDYRPGSMVEHTGFGEGIVTAIEGDVLTIAFKNSQVGVKKISKNFRGLRGK